MLVKCIFFLLFVYKLFRINCENQRLKNLEIIICIKVVFDIGVSKVKIQEKFCG